ncbi:copper fist DNA binding domain-containing protein [Scleroderma yunnanense]
MVFVNDKKYACESCIKGHRSSSCKHTERPLFEVKKKGRPVSQCADCRNLRQAKRVHSKCSCHPPSTTTDRIPIPAAHPDRKARRFMPSKPSLPNGISDVLKSPDTLSYDNAPLSLPECTHRAPCKCSAVPTSESTDRMRQFSGLAALADAAAMFSEKAQLTTPVLPHSDNPPGSCCTKWSIPPAGASQNLDLPPIYSVPLGSAPQLPDFRVMPPLETIKSIAGSGCTCGLYCACPGCTEHRLPTHVAKDRRDCKSGCGDCVDHGSGIALPGPDLPGAEGSLVDVFFGSARSHPMFELPRGRGPRTIDSTDVLAQTTKDSSGEQDRSTR